MCRAWRNTLYGTYEATPRLPSAKGRSSAGRRTARCARSMLTLIAWRASMQHSTRCGIASQRSSAACRSRRRALSAGRPSTARWRRRPSSPPARAPVCCDGLGKLRRQAAPLAWLQLTFFHGLPAPEAWSWKVDQMATKNRVESLAHCSATYLIHVLKVVPPCHVIRKGHCMVSAKVERKAVPSWTTSHRFPPPSPSTLLASPRTTCSASTTRRASRGPGPSSATPSLTIASAWRASALPRRTLSSLARLRAASWPTLPPARGCGACRSVAGALELFLQFLFFLLAVVVFLFCFVFCVFFFFFYLTPSHRATIAQSQGTPVRFLHVCPPPHASCFYAASSYGEVRLYRASVEKGTRGQSESFVQLQEETCSQLRGLLAADMQPSTRPLLLCRLPLSPTLSPPLSSRPASLHHASCASRR